jgi:DNA-binding transcriptional ArsR family regulator
MDYQDRQAPVDLSVLAVLADPTRRSLLELLRHKPLPVGELARQMPVSRPAVSQHLKILKEAQLVREHRSGTRHYFGLNPAGFGGLRAYADSMWQDALSAFAAYVAEQKRAATKSPARKRKER